MLGYACLLVRQLCIDTYSFAQDTVGTLLTAVAAQFPSRTWIARDRTSHLSVHDEGRTALLGSHYKNGQTVDLDRYYFRCFEWEIEDLMDSVSHSSIQ